MKVVTVGGGSTYTPELVQGLIDRHRRLELRELWLVDIDAERLEIVGGFARRMAAAAGDPFSILLTTDRNAALKGADFVTTQIRVGQMEARREDEALGRRWNLVGQETTGVGGMAKALRTVPVVLSIAEDMRAHCPGAWLVNFTNPAGLVTEAVQRHVPEVHSIGLCNSPIGWQMAVARQMKLEDPFDVHLDYLGLNHLSWIRGARVGDRDVWPQVFSAALEGRDKAASQFLPGEILESLGVICNTYLYYYYCTGRALREQSQGQPPRAEKVIEIEERLLEQYADPSRHTIPPELMQRGGAHYSTAAVQLIEAIALDLGQEQILDTRQGDAVPGFPPDWVMELPCRVDRQGVHPLPSDPLPLFADGLLRAVKAYELLTVQAAVGGERDAALQALVAHPLGPDADRAPAVLEDLLETHRAYLPRFFRCDAEREEG